jgi:hypothetical protein
MSSPPLPAAFECVPVALDLEFLRGSQRPARPICHAPLDLHQPDAGRPDRLLGTCEACNAWLLVDRRGGLMLLLPDALPFNSALASTLRRRRPGPRRRTAPPGR